MSNLLDFKSVFEFAIDPAATTQVEDVVRRHALPLERSGELQQLIAAILKNEADYHAIPQFIGAAFGLDEEKAKAVSADLAGYRLLPLQLYIPGIKQTIVEWGGVLTSYPSTIVSKEKVTPEALIEQFAKKLELELPEPLMRRFVYLCRGYLMGERTREGTMVLFKRPVTIGGLEMSDSQTLRCLEMLDKEKENVEVVEMEAGIQHQHIARPQMTAPSPIPAQEGEDSSTEEEKIIPEAQLPQQTPVDVRRALVKTVTHTMTTSVPTISGEMIEPHEKKEIEAAKRVVAQQPSPDTDQKQKIDAEIEAAVAPLGEIFKKKRLTKQDLAEIATAHIRGRREYLQTEGLLKERFALSAEETVIGMQALEHARRIAQAPVNDSVAIGGGAKPSVAAKDVGKREQEVLDARFAALTKRVPDVPIDPVMPSGRVSAARSKEEELAMQAAKIDPVKVAQAEVASKPEKANVLISAASAPMAARPPSVMTDVQYVPNLMGPVEEIGSMTPDQFRRLSSDPMEAIRKIEDKLALLEGLSYADRIRGIEGWRKNPVSLLYMSMAREALVVGISLAELAAKRRAAGEESLSPAEIAAVVELNRRIGF